MIGTHAPGHSGKKERLQTLVPERANHPRSIVTCNVSGIKWFICRERPFCQDRVAVQNVFYTYNALPHFHWPDITYNTAHEETLNHPHRALYLRGDGVG